MEDTKKNLKNFDLSLKEILKKCRMEEIPKNMPVRNFEGSLMNHYGETIRDLRMRKI